MSKILYNVVFAMVVCGAVARPQGGIPLPILGTAPPATTGEIGIVGLASLDDPFAGTAPDNNLISFPEASPVLPSALASAPVSPPRSDSIPSPPGAPVYTPTSMTSSSSSASAPVSPPRTDSIPSPPGAPVYAPQSTSGSETSLPTGITMIIKAVLVHSAFNVPAELYPGPLITPAPVIAADPITTPTPAVYSTELTTASSVTFFDDRSSNSFSISIDPVFKSDLTVSTA